MLKEKKLTVKDHRNIIFRHAGMNIILTLAMGIFAAYTQRNIFLNAAFGFVLGLILSYVLEYLDRTLKTPEDIKHCAEISFLGYIPAAEKGLKSSENADLASHQKNHPHVAKAFRKAAERLMDSFSEEESARALVVSSSVSKEGKSFAATNLAIALAIIRGPVLLIDGDLRKGRLSEIFDAGGDKGLANALAGTFSWQEVIVSTAIHNLSLLPRGAPVPNPAELLGTGKIKDILKEAKKRFKMIIIDSPPILSVTDTLVLGSECDGLIFVIKSGAISLKHITDAKKMIKGKIKILGAVLNGMAA